MPGPQRIVIDEAFINKVRNDLDTMAKSLGRLRTTAPPLLSSVKVVAGADGYTAATNLETAVATGGTNLDTRLSDLKLDLDRQVLLLDRFMAENDEIEDLNTQAPSAIISALDSDFFKASSIPNVSNVPGVTS